MPVHSIIQNKLVTYAEELFAATTLGLEGCYSTDSIWVNIIDDTGIMENKDSGVKVFPNPAREYLIVEIDNQNIKSYQLQLFDIFGQSMIDLEFDTRISNSKHVSLSELKGGLYMIKITFDKFTFEDKLLIQE